MPVFSKRSVEAIVEQGDDVEEPPPQVLLPSSKLGIIVMPEIIPEEDATTPVIKDKVPKLLPGSKSFFVIPPDQEKSE